MLFYIKRREEPPNMVSIQKNGIFREEGMGMERYFNTEGVCDPQLHYMVRLITKYLPLSTNRRLISSALSSSLTI